LNHKLQTLNIDLILNSSTLNPHTRNLQALGFSALGTAGGMEGLHYLFEKAWDVPGVASEYSN